jgi:hypothetical protein
LPDGRTRWGLPRDGGWGREDRLRCARTGQARGSS